MPFKESIDLVYLPTLFSSLKCINDDDDDDDDDDRWARKKVKKSCLKNGTRGTMGKEFQGKICLLCSIHRRV